MAAYCRVYDSRHLQADCKELRSAPEPYAQYGLPLPFFSNNVSILHHFSVTATFRVYVTACRGPNLEKDFHFCKTVAIKDHRYFPIHVH